MAIADNFADIVSERVAQFYWQHDRNCATTTLCVLAELFAIELNKQTIDAAVALHGAGKYGAQCGLLEGSIILQVACRHQLNLRGRGSKFLDR
jgi:hypothetical protein